jgi:hypothetical protein
MSYRNYSSREGGRHHTDPTSSRYNTSIKYRPRGRGINNRPVRDHDRRPTGGDDLDRITVSIGRNLTTDGINNQGPPIRGRIVNRFPRPQIIRPGGRRDEGDSNQIKWWRVSIQQAGAIGKERVMSTLKGYCDRDFQPYHVNLFKNNSNLIIFI